MNMKKALIIILAITAFIAGLQTGLYVTKNKYSISIEDSINYAYVDGYADAMIQIISDSIDHKTFPQTPKTVSKHLNEIIAHLDSIAVNFNILAFADTTIEFKQQGNKCLLRMN